MHHPEDFPLVRDRGFVIGPGQEVFVGVDGADVYSTLDAKTVSPIKRKCYFREERTLDYYTNYTRSNCLQECSFKFIKSVCGCVPYYFPSKSADASKPRKTSKLYFKAEPGGTKVLHRWHQGYVSYHLNEVAELLN